MIASRQPQQACFGLRLACAIAAGARRILRAARSAPRFHAGGRRRCASISSSSSTFVLAATAFVTLRHAARPEFGGKPFRCVLLTGAGLAAGCGVLGTARRAVLSDWVARWFGHNWIFCMTFIPILSLGPLAVLLVALRIGASTAPARTGAIAGLLAGGIGAVFYALHCPGRLAALRRELVHDRRSRPSRSWGPPSVRACCAGSIP